MKRRGYYSPKRRAAMYHGEQINHLEVFESYGWVCNICQSKIDRRLRVPNWQAATLDHIIPLARGGTHTRDNVAPAHYKCNMDKGDALPGERSAMS